MKDKSKNVTAVTLFMILLAASSLNAQTPKTVDQRVSELLAHMTIEEKVGQLTQYTKGQGTDEDIRSGRVGSFLWVKDPNENLRMQKIAVEQSRLHVPLIFGMDVIHGYRTIFPEPLALASSFDTALAEKVQAAAAQEASASGINWTFAPMIDIGRDARWGRVVEGAGEDPFLGSRMAEAQVRGFQGNTLGEPNHIVACAKHFVGYGAPDGGREYDSVDMSESRLRNVYLPPFRAAVNAGVGTVMNAYMDLNDVPLAGSPHMLRDVLRKDLGFKGYVISDWDAVRDLTTHGFAADDTDAAKRALIAGVNMDMHSQAYQNNLPALVKSGAVSIKLLDEAVREVLTIKFKAGLFDRPYIDPSRTASLTATPAIRALAREAAVRSAVLLKNTSNVLPLNRDLKIALVGPLADSKHDMVGPWSPLDHDEEVVTVLDGLRAKTNRAQPIAYAKGSNILKDYTQPYNGSEILGAMYAVQDADVIVAVLGEDRFMSGEGASRTSLEIPGQQLELLHRLVETKKPVVLVLINGRPLTLQWAKENVSAILEVWYPGSEAGNAVADLLYGDANPGGKLPISFPLNVGQEPLFYAHNVTHKPETAADFKSRYWDSPISPLFPFGFGLSYTSFEIAKLSVAKNVLRVGEPLKFNIEVKNTGSAAGDEVVQAYIHQKYGAASRPVRELKAFQRVSLAAGEAKTIELRIPPEELAYWRPDGTTAQDESSFDLWVGSSSVGGLHGKFEVRR